MKPIEKIQSEDARQLANITIHELRGLLFSLSIAQKRLLDDAPGDLNTASEIITLSISKMSKLVAAIENSINIETYSNFDFMKGSTK